MEPSRFTAQCVEVDVDGEVWFLPAAGGGVGGLKKTGGEVAEGVVRRWVADLVSVVAGGGNNVSIAVFRVSPAGPVMTNRPVTIPLAKVAVQSCVVPTG